MFCFELIYYVNIKLLCVTFVSNFCVFHSQSQTTVEHCSAFRETEAREAQAEQDQTRSLERG